MGRLNLKYVETFKDRHGKLRAYFRYKRNRTPLPSPDDPTFAAAYKRLLIDAIGEAEPSKANGKDALGWLIAEYMASPEFTRKLSDRTQEDYRAILNDVRIEYGANPWRELTRARIMKKIRDPWADKPRRADYRVAVMSAMFTWAVKRDIAKENPCKGIDKLNEKGEGHRAWTPAEIAKFLAECGDREYEVFVLALYTGQRPGDLRTLKWSQWDGERFTIRQSKTRQPLVIRAHPVLKELLDGMERRGDTILTRPGGEAFTQPQLSVFFKDALRRMGMPEGVTLYGLRATHADALADAGATPHQIAAMTGHRTLAMVAHYTRAADQRRLAEASVSLLPSLKRTV